MVQDVITFLEANPAVLAIVAGLVAEVIRRFLPTKSKESLIEIIGRFFRVVLDFAKLPNNEKKK